MQNLPATLITALLTIAVHGVAYAADSEETPYVIQQEHAAPVTITELPGSNPSQTAAQATSIDDQVQASEAYAERRQRMIEQCEQNNGIDCAREVDTELRAEAIQRHPLVHTMRRAGASR